MQLRDYQQSAVDALIRYWQAGGGNGLIVLPTGSGKSLVIAELLRRLVTDWPGTRVLLVSHVREILAQNIAKIAALYPEADVGIHSDGLGRRDTQQAIIVGGIQSLFRNPTVIGPRHVVIVDEAHLVGRDDHSSYQKLIKALAEMTPGMRVAGLSATPYRTTSGLLTQPWKNREPLFNDVVYDAKIVDLIEQGFLSPVISRCTDEQLDVAGVGTRNGEFIAGELERAINLDEVNVRIVDDVIKQSENRKSILAFTAGKAHATNVAACFRERGVPTEILLGDTNTKERDRILTDFKSGALRCLVSVNVVLVGFDAPNVDCIAICRPTKSLGLHVQMIGRGMRLAPGKSDCLVLDYAGNCERHGVIDQADGYKDAKEGKGAAPVKDCPGCHNYIHASALKCKHCGHDFSPPKVEEKLSVKPVAAPVISGDISLPQWWDVHGVSYTTGQKPGKPEYMQCIYHVGVGATVRETVCFEHTGYPAIKAARWWHDRGSQPYPKTTQEAFERAEGDELREPVRVQCKKAGKYWEIVNVEFAGEAKSPSLVKRLEELSF